MARKSSVLSLLKTELQRINGSTDTRPEIPGSPYTFKTSVDLVSDHFKYLEQVHNRVELTFVPSTETRQYLGTGEIYGSIEVYIRGFVKSGDDYAEPDNLLEDLEYIIGGFQMMRQHDIEDARILGLVSDEGLFEPWHIIDARVEIKYRIDPII